MAALRLGFELILMTKYRAGTHFGEDGYETDLHKKVKKKRKAEQKLSPTEWTDNVSVKLKRNLHRFYTHKLAVPSHLKFYCISEK